MDHCFSVDPGLFWSLRFGVRRHSFPLEWEYVPVHYNVTNRRSAMQFGIEILSFWDLTRVVRQYRGKAPPITLHRDYRRYDPSQYGRCISRPLFMYVVFKVDLTLKNAPHCSSWNRWVMNQSSSSCHPSTIIIFTIILPCLSYLESVLLRLSARSYHASPPFV